MRSTACSAYETWPLRLFPANSAALQKFATRSAYSIGWLIELRTWVVSDQLLVITVGGTWFCWPFRLDRGFGFTGLLINVGYAVAFVSALAG